MTNYEKLRDRLNILLPDRLELKFGCEIFREGSAKREFIAGKFNNKIAIVKYDEFGAWMPFEVPLPPLSQSFTILGPPVSITDVLQGLGDKYSIDGSGMVLERQFGTSSYDCAGLPMVILSLPLDHKDNDAACGALVELLK